MTGIVYDLVLATAEHLVGLAKVGDTLAATVSPLLYVGTWICLAPGSLRQRHVGQMLAFPALWIAATPTVALAEAAVWFDRIGVKARADQLLDHLRALDQTTNAKDVAGALNGGYE